MRFIWTTVHIAIIVVILAACTPYKNNNMKVQGPRDEIDSLLKKLLPVDTEERNRIVTAIPSIETQQEVQDSLLRIANQTQESRSEVVEALIQILEDPQARGESPLAYRWTIAVDILGELKATESIDILIKNLDQTGEHGFVSSLGYHPVGRALTNIGEPAIPQLIAVLSSSEENIRDLAELALANMGEPAIPKMQEALAQDDPRTRRGAAQVLAWIGGEEARTAIERAILREEDQEVLKELKDVLKKMLRRWGGAGKAS